MKKIVPFIYLFLFITIPSGSKAQEVLSLDSIVQKHEQMMEETPVYAKKEIAITEKELRKLLDRQPAFATYKDQFFISGISLHEPINSNTADAMFQISVRQRLTRSYLPFGSFAFITYSQKSFWDLYAESCPFRDTNYNPGIGIGRYIIKNNKLKGAMFMQLEHESNGRDSLESRSWNYLSFAIKYFYNPRVTIGVKAWIPYVDGEENKDLLDYKGLATFNANFLTRNNKWWFSAEVTPRKGIGNMNTIATAAFRLSKNHNQYAFARFYNGKGDSMLDYNKYEMNVRIGICIKPDFFSIY